MSTPTFLSGDAVDLRPVEQSDVEFLQRVNEERIRTGIGAVNPIPRHAEEDWIESIGDSEDVQLLVWSGEDRVGMVGLNDPNVVRGHAEVGYWIAPEAWGNGYATEAVELMCDHAFRERRLHKVFASAYVTNEASCRVLEKAGFEREGTLREEGFVDGSYVDLARYGILATEWFA